MLRRVEGPSIEHYRTEVTAVVMATLHDLHRFRWEALVPGIPYVAENGIPTFFRQHPEVGSPIGVETQLDDGGIGQVFSGGVVRWDSEAGAALVTD